MALPFLLAVNVTVGAVIAAVFSLIEERDQEGRLNPADTSTPDNACIRPLLSSGYMRLAARFLVSSVGAIIICFVMFGGSSPFHKIHSTNITRYRLPTPTNSNAHANCAPVSAPNTDLDTDIFPRQAYNALGRADGGRQVGREGGGGLAGMLTNAALHPWDTIRDAASRWLCRLDAHANFVSFECF